MKPDSILDRFATVTLVPVVFNGRLAHELRLYLPNRIEADGLRGLLSTTASVCSEHAGGPENFQLEFNRWGMCFNAFVTPTGKLRELVNETRRSRGLKPCLA